MNSKLQREVETSELTFFLKMKRIIKKKFNKITIKIKKEEKAICYYNISLKLK